MQALQTYLKDKDITQAQFAERVGVSQPTVSDWINGHIYPSGEKLLEISRITRLSIDELLANKTKKAS